MSTFLLDWVAPIVFWALVILYWTVRSVRIFIHNHVFVHIKDFIMTALKDFIKWVKSLKWKLLKLWAVYMIVTSIIDTIMLTVFGDMGKVGDALQDKWENGTLISSSTIKALVALWELILTFLKSVGLIVIKTIMPFKVDSSLNHGILFVVAIIVIIILIAWIKVLFREKEMIDYERSKLEKRTEDESK